MTAVQAPVGSLPGTVGAEFTYWIPARTWGDVLRTTALYAVARSQEQLAVLPFRARTGNLWSLACSGQAPVMAWQAADDESAFLGFGSAWLLEAEDPSTIEELFGTVEAYLADAQEIADVCGTAPQFVRAYGAVAFDHHRGDPGYAAAFRVPSVTLCQQPADGQEALGAVAIVVSPGESTLAVAERARQALDQLQANLLAARSERAPTGWQLVDTPAGRTQYEEAVERALAAIGHQDLDKIVLSRELTVIPPETDTPLSGWAAFAAMARSAPATARYAVDFGELYFGASPERLVAISGGVVRADCLAGTQLAGPGTAKELREHDIVAKALQAALRPLSVEVAALPDPIWRLVPGLSHLWSPVEAQLAENVSVGSVVRAVHPTPAVGGWPRQAALEQIRNLEGRCRGWYAGAIGWLGYREADFAVGIRGLRWSPRGPIVTVGAGIVAGSTPHGECLETLRKAEAVVGMLNSVGAEGGGEP
ncbi:MAG: chorismate-binding protein [Cyanobacteria bacterium REEB65]|nr:chorismate-binding protein [Cyanobacteria bacterium REEB65]